MYTCGELTHSPSVGDLAGRAGHRPDPRLQKRAAARNGLFMHGPLNKKALLKSAATDGRFRIPMISEVCTPRVASRCTRSWTIARTKRKAKLRLAAQHRIEA
jgi:hypothetical protein